MDMRNSGGTDKNVLMNELNDKYMQYYNLKISNPQENSAKLKNLKSEIWIKSLEIIKKMYGKRVEASKIEDIVNDLFMKNTLIEDFDPFCKDGEQKTFSERLFSNLRFGKLDLYRKEKKKTDNEASIINSYENVDESEEIDIKDLSSDIENQYSHKEQLKEILTKLSMPIFIINFFEHKKGKAANEARLRYYKLFYTEDITKIVKEIMNKTYINIMEEREQNIFKCLNINFLDYFMMDICRNIKSIKEKPLKNHVKYNENEELVEIPFSAKIYRSYLENMENKKVSDSNISQQKTEYRLEIDSLRI